MRLAAIALVALAVLVVGCNQDEGDAEVDTLRTQVASLQTQALGGTATTPVATPTGTPRYPAEYAIQRVRDAEGNRITCSLFIWTDHREESCPVSILEEAQCLGETYWPYQEHFQNAESNPTAKHAVWYAGFDSAGGFWEVGTVCRTSSEFGPLPERRLVEVGGSLTTDASWLLGLVARFYEDTKEIVPMGPLSQFTFE